MQADRDSLQKHYSALSDEALLEIDPSDLTETARHCYAAEIKSRGLNSTPDKGRDRSSRDETPDWLDEAAVAFSAMAHPGTGSAAESDDARRVLEAAGIPCFVEIREVSQEEEPARRQESEWRVMVPGNLNMHAASILERDIFNEDFEAEWKAHLELLSDDEVLAMSPEAVFCGLYDRIERATRAYREELVRRELKAE